MSSKAPSQGPGAARPQFGERLAVAASSAWLAAAAYAVLSGATARLSGPGAINLGDRATLAALAFGHLLAPAALLAGLVALVRWTLAAALGRLRPSAQAATQGSPVSGDQARGGRHADPGRTARVVMLLLILAATVTHLTDMRVYVGLYAWAHALLGLATLSLLVLGASFGPRISTRAPGRWVALALGLGALASPLLVWPMTAPLLAMRPASAPAAFRSATGLTHALGLATFLGDGDADGFSGLFGGGDCDDDDARVHPLAFDVPGDGVDQDCSGADASPPGPTPLRRSRLSGLFAQRRPHVLLITYEALRADRLAALGRPGPPLLPNLEQVASRAALFGNAYSPSCWTVPAIWSLLTGVAPRKVRWTPIAIDQDDRVFALEQAPSASLFGRGFSRHVHPDPLRDEHTTLPQALRAAGYRSVTAASYLRFRRGVGIGNAFDTVDGRVAAAVERLKRLTPAPVLTTIAQEVVQRELARGQPLLIWLHYLDAHEPYVRLEAEKSFGQGPEALYDGELHRADLAVGRLLAWLNTQGLLEDMVIVATGDHGEAFGEHGARFHGSAIYDEQTRVPLVLRFPGLPVQPGPRWEPVSLVDVMPTLLDLLGLPLPSGLSGRTLLPLLAGDPWTPQPVVLECTRFEHALLGVVDGNYKLVEDQRFGTRSLFDLRQDPQEQINLAGLRPRQLDRLSGWLRAWRDGLTGRGRPDDLRRPPEPITGSAPPGRGD